jgi:hypothetical protein
MIWNNISFLLSMHTPFLFGIQLKSVETTHRKKKCVPKTMVFLWFCCFVFSMFWSLGTIRINPNQIWIILPLGHHVFIKCTLYKSLLKKNKHAQYSLEMCDFPFNGWSLWGCAIVFFCWVKHVLQLKDVPFQIRGNWDILGFFKRNIAFFSENWCYFQT